MRTQPHPALPQGYSRRDVIALVADVGRDIGLSTRLTDILTRMIGSTDQDAWVDPEKEPIFYGRQETFAQRLRISTRQLRSHEKSLQKHGLIQRRTLANGSRYGSAGLGLVLTPLIERFTEFLDIREARKAQFERMKQLKALRSVRLATFRDELARLSEDDQSSADVQAMIQERTTWPRTDTLLSLGEAQLSQHLDDATSLCTTLVEWIENHSDSSCEPEETFRSYIQEDIHQIHSEECNASDNKRSAGLPAHSDSIMSEPDGPDDCREKQLQAETEALQGLFSGFYGLSHAISLASEEFQMEMEARSGERPEYALVEAAAARVPHLGINITAWAAACDRMGRTKAAICILLLDANRDHAVNPVRNPGGALRGMIKAHNRGKLNIIGSLIGLHRRRGL
ncbi:replication initiation protein RepC [Litoreibacter meonggei]|uniref:Replication initiation protein RepC n=2 Tax=Rhodobacterales TaxID=204455 RepID=A0A497VAM3_9RHOB|nr:MULTISPECIES: replication initiation protein RepC [Rhodobacterales]MDU9006498.1 replication initiation protein RepC [Sedimentitalea todarodis]RLJ40621.1 replication initiation protein RepC [Litoreibacter meonggei]